MCKNYAAAVKLGGEVARSAWRVQRTAAADGGRPKPGRPGQLEFLRGIFDYFCHDDEE